LSELADTSQLLIAEQEELINDGANIVLVERDQRLRFLVNLKDLDKKGTRISSKLLSLAEHVTGIEGD
jgi:hypothetical protein